jgi:hypothetical protein
MAETKTHLGIEEHATQPKSLVVNTRPDVFVPRPHPNDEWLVGWSSAAAEHVVSSSCERRTAMSKPRRAPVEFKDRRVDRIIAAFDRSEAFPL